jgi:hypothetical protein
MMRVRFDLVSRIGGKELILARFVCVETLSRTLRVR